MEDALGNHSPMSIKLNKKTTNEKIRKQNNARKLMKEKNQTKKKNTKEKTKKASSGESVNLYRRNANQNVLDSTIRSGSLRTEKNGENGKNGKSTHSGNRRKEIEDEKRKKEKRKKTGKPIGKNGGKIKKLETQKSTGSEKALKRSRTSKSTLTDDMSANDKKKKHKTSKSIPKTHKAREAYGTKTAKKQPGETDKEVKVTHHLTHEVHIIGEKENTKDSRNTDETEKNLHLKKSLSGNNMLTQRKEKATENQANVDYFNINSFNKSINNFNSHSSINNTNPSDAYNSNVNAHKHSIHNSNNTIYNNNSNTPDDNNTTKLCQQKQAEKEEPRNDALFEDKTVPLEINGTISKPFSPLFKKEARAFFTEDHSIFKLKRDASVTLNNLKKSKYYSTGHIRMSDLKKKNELLKSQITKEIDKLSLRPEQKKRMSWKENDTVKSKGNGGTSPTAKMKKNILKLKKEKTSEFHVDMKKQRSSSLTNKHVHITGDVQILKPPSRNTVARYGEVSDSIENSMWGRSLNAHKMELHGETEEMQEKEKEEGGESDMGEYGGTLLTAIKSMRLEWAGGAHGEEEEEEEEAEDEEVDEKEREYKEQSSDGKRSHGTNDEKEKYKKESEDKVLEKHNEKTENVEEGKERQKTDLSNCSPNNSQLDDTQLNNKDTIDPLKEKVDNILKQYISHKRKKNAQKRRKYTPLMEPLDIQEQSLQMDTIKFLSNLKPDLYCDDIIFFFDNYEKKVKKQEDLIKGFNRLFKSENFDVDGFQSVLLIFDQIIKKMKRDLTTFPLQSFFTHMVREMQKMREGVDLPKKKEDHAVLCKSTNDTQEVFTPNKFAQVYIKKNILAESKSLTTEENKIVEVKIKKLQKYHGIDLYNPVNDYSAYKTEHLKFIPYLLRRHWHDPKKLEILRNILKEMESRKTPKHLKIADVNVLQKKSNLWDLLCCCNCANSQIDKNECDCPVYSQRSIHSDYPAKSCHRYLPFDYVQEIPSHKLSDAIHYMAYN